MVLFCCISKEILTTSSNNARISWYVFTLRWSFLWIYAQKLLHYALWRKMRSLHLQLDFRVSRFSLISILYDVLFAWVFLVLSGLASFLKRTPSDCFFGDFAHWDEDNWSCYMPRNSSCCSSTYCLSRDIIELSFSVPYHK